MMEVPYQNAAVVAGNLQLIPAQPQPQPTIQVGGVNIPTITHTQYVQRLDARTLDPRLYRNVVGDSTTFVNSQQEWGPDRADRPAITFQLYPPVNRVSTDPGFLFTPSPTAAFPAFQVVVDRDGQPLRNFPELPTVISTKVEGWLIEAWMRLNMKLKHEDVIQRMLHLDADSWAGRDNGGGFKNTLSARRRDFRQIGRCLSWEENSARKSAFDRRLLDDVASNPLWQAEQTTRYLEDLTLDEKKELIAANSKVRGARKDVDKGSSNALSSVPPKRRAEQQPEGQPGSKLPRVDESKLTLDDFDWDGIDADAEEAQQARLIQGFGTIGGNLSRPPLTWGPQGGTSSTRVEGTPTAWYSDSPQAPGSAEQNAMPVLSSAFSQNLGSLTGQNLVAWLAERGVSYSPSYPIPPEAPEQQDARLLPAMDTEERRQLFLALYPAILAAVRSGPHQFIVDLSLSYAFAYKILQDQTVHASYLDDNMADLAKAELTIAALPAWTGEIGDFDVAGVPQELRATVEGREEMKVQNAPYVLSHELQERALAEGMLIEDGSVFWPNRLMVQAGLDGSLGVVVELVEWLN